MKAIILKYWNLLSSLGITESSNLVEQQRVKLLNQVILIAIILQTVLIVHALTLPAFEAVVSGLLMLLFSAIPLYLNFLGKIKLSTSFQKLFNVLSLYPKDNRNEKTTYFFKR